MGLVEKFETTPVLLADSNWSEVPCKDVSMKEIDEYCNNKFDVNAIGHGTFSPVGDTYKTYSLAIAITREMAEDYDCQKWEARARQYLTNQVLTFFEKEAKRKAKPRKLYWRVRPYFYNIPRPDYDDNLMVVRMRLLIK